MNVTPRAAVASAALALVGVVGVSLVSSGFQNVSTVELQPGQQITARCPRNISVQSNNDKTQGKIKCPSQSPTVTPSASAASPTPTARPTPTATPTPSPTATP